MVTVVVVIMVAVMVMVVVELKKVRLMVVLGRMVRVCMVAGKVRFGGCVGENGEGFGDGGWDDDKGWWWWRWGR